ncbi:MAG: hypothetical protein JRI76_14065 [Deltaproteobacteria bacterium]|nr:hypothetical protein [Deltaproteobacteria bacterium]
MKITVPICILFLFAFFPASAYALEPEPSFRISGFFQARGDTDIVEDEKAEQLRSFRNIARLQGKWRPLEADDLHLLASVESDFLWFGPDPEYDDYDFDLFEGYLFYRRGFFDMTLGKQIVRWGKTDEISPVDVLNPQDLREFFLYDYAERKLPNWMARLRAGSGPVFLEGIWIPFFTPANFDYFDTDWAVFRHVKSDAAKSGLPGPIRSYIQSLSVNEDEPSDDLENSQYGARLAASFSGWDFGVSYVYGWETLPFFESFPIKNIQVDGAISYEALRNALKNAVFTDEAVEATFKRYQSWGFEFETTVSVFGLRGEFAYYDDQSFLTRSLTSIQKPVYHYVLGLDYSSLSDWYVNFQFSHQVVSDYDPKILYFRKDNYLLLGKIEKGFLGKKLLLKLDYSFNLEQSDFYLSPEIVIKSIPNLELGFGATLFEGDPDTLMGQYDANDAAFINVKYHF